MTPKPMNDEQNKTLVEIMEVLKDKPDHTQVETTWGHFKDLISQARLDERQAVIKEIKLGMLGIITSVGYSMKLSDGQIAVLNRQINDLLAQLEKE